MTQHAPGTKEHFLSSFNWPFPYAPLDSTIYFDFYDGSCRLARIEPAASGTSGQMEGLRVTILDKLCETIDSKFFRFDDYLSERSDGRGDYPLRGNPTFMVITHLGWDWYIATPTTTAPLTEAVTRYIDLFKIGNDGA